MAMKTLSLYKCPLLAAFISLAPCTALAADTTARPSRIVNTIFNKLVIFEIPAGWRPGQQNANQTQHVIEFIPQHQTLKTWKEMITMQTFRDMAQNPKITPAAMLSVLATGIKKVCGDEFVAQALGDKKIDSLDAYAAIIGCGRLPNAVASANEGQSEIGLYVAIKGDRDVYVFQRAIRGNAFDKTKPPISATNIDDSFLLLHSLKLCGGSIPIEQCSLGAAR
jgi:hypothetical protein